MTLKTDDWDRDERDALKDVRDELERLRTRHAGDPPVDLLRAARGHALPEDLQTEADRRLVESAWSRALVDGLADTEDGALSPVDEERLLARIKKSAAPFEPRRGWAGFWSPAFAAAAAAAIVSTIWIGSRGSAPEPAPAQPAPAAAVPAPPPAFELPLGKPEIKLSVAALTWRGAGGDNQFLSDLKPAIDAFRAGEYQAADRAFSALTGRYPRSIEIPFYHGVTLLFLNDVPSASQRLSEAERVADQAFASDVAWYRAVAEQRAGNLAGSRERLAGLCGGASDRSAAACDALKKLEAASPAPR